MELQWESISCRFLGLNRQVVKNHIEGIIKSYESQVKKLKDEINSAVEQKQSLLQELSDYKSRINSFKIDQELINISKRRLESTLMLLRNASDNETLANLESTRERLAEYEIIIERKKNDIINLKRSINSILENFMGVLPEYSNASANPDNETVNNETKLLKTNKKDKEGDMAAEKSSSSSLLYNSSDKSDFWGSINLSNAEPGSLQKKVPQADKIDSSTTYNDVNAGTDKGINVKAAKNIDDIDSEGSSDNKGHSGMESKALQSQISQIRYKYIVGKLAGEDLFDKKGHLIVGKNSPITNEVVVKAENDGKLSELIINMVLPGLE